MDLEKLALEALLAVRPSGIEVDAYPQVVKVIVNLVLLEVTKSGG